MTKSNPDKQLFFFTWYHREEFQVLLILVGLIVFFARSYWVLITLAAFVIAMLALLYLARILEGYFKKRVLFPSIVQRYQDLKTALHGHSIERSRIAMALLAAWILGVLCLHRIQLAQISPTDRTPTDIYWIIFLGLYRNIVVSSFNCSSFNSEKSAYRENRFLFGSILTSLLGIYRDILLCTFTTEYPSS